jgi:hypothetical protein
MWRAISEIIRDFLKRDHAWMAFFLMMTIIIAITAVVVVSSKSAALAVPFVGAAISRSVALATRSSS